MDIEQELNLIKERNQRVEAEKAWEVSWARRLFLTLITYIFAGIWLELINDNYPWLKALVPAVGYLLSTLSLPFVKERWMRRKLQ